MTLQASVQRRAGEVWDRRLEGVETVIEWQKRVPAEGDDNRLLIGGEHGGASLFRPHTLVGCSLTLLPFLDRGGADAVALGQRSYALLAPLYRATDCLRRGGAAVENLAHSSSLARWR